MVLETFSRRGIGWSVDAGPTAALASNALRESFRARVQVDLLNRRRWRAYALTA